MYEYEYLINESKKLWVDAVYDCGEETAKKLARRLEEQENLKARPDWGVLSLIINKIYKESIDASINVEVQEYSDGNFMRAGGYLAYKDKYSYVFLLRGSDRVD